MSGIINMADEYHCDECGKPLEECEFYIEMEKILKDIDSGKIKMVTQSADEFIAELKELDKEE